METLLSQAQALLPELQALRRALHGCPELGFELPATRALVCGELDRIGIPYVPCAGGIVATLGNAAQGPTVLLRADLDALPMAEKSGLPFAATGDCCHACGHDLHAAMLLGAARLLFPLGGQLRGAVRLMFQPAEEIARGARAMLEAGVLEGPKPDAAIGIHTEPGRKTGRINCTPGYKTASFDSFAVTFTGKGGHGAQPQRTIDPINAAVHAYTMLEAMISRECAPAEPAVLTVGSFHGGAAGNIIPETARMEGTCRAASAQGRDLLKKRLEEICAGVAATCRATAALEWLAEVPPLYNQPDMATRLACALQQAGLNANDQAERLSASEDFALVAEQVPTLYLNIGTGAAEDGYSAGNHDPAVRYDEDALAHGAAALAVCALEELAFCAKPATGRP